MVYDLIVAGGGAAGFYCALQAGEMQEGIKILIVEKSPRLLSKVRVSGGGRCNVTHHCFEPKKLSGHYPRGEKFLRDVFAEYQVSDVVEWFEKNGVKLKTEDDGRMFPVTDDSETIIKCFLNQAEKLGIEIITGEAIEQIVGKDKYFEVRTSSQILKGKKILIATGGHPNISGYHHLTNSGIPVVKPIPSLFTFNDKGKIFKDLMGISVPRAEVKIAATKFAKTGPLLITHWGLSGPAVIKLSAWAAIHLNKSAYRFTALVSWIGPSNEEEIRAILGGFKVSKARQKVFGNPQFNLPSRLWVRLCEISEIPPDKVWSELSVRHINKLLENLIRCPFYIEGKTTFKEEFVTCGGVELSEVDIRTMESKKIKGLYFAGEVLNIDGETGGFNFQAAWSTAYTAARSIVKSLSSPILE